jgi:hypothetical protein
MLKEHPSLKSLCGNRGDETELDMSGKMFGAEDAIMLVAEIVNNGALVCADGRLYHEWVLNPLYIELKAEGRIEVDFDSGWYPGTIKAVNADGTYRVDFDDGDKAPSVLKARIKGANEFKYVSKAPDIIGQNEDPDVPLGSNTCCRCNTPNNQHSASRGMTSLNLASNSLGNEGAKIIAAFLPNCM